MGVMSQKPMHHGSDGNYIEMYELWSDTKSHPHWSDGNEIKIKDTKSHTYGNVYNIENFDMHGSTGIKSPAYGSDVTKVMHHRSDVNDIEMHAFGSNIKSHAHEHMGVIGMISKFKPTWE